MKAMILAAGRGERMRPLTDTLPKPLLTVKGCSLIEHHLKALAKAGFTNVVINHAWLGEKIVEQLGDGEKWQLNIHYSDESQGALETAGGIAKALSLLQSNDDADAPFLVVNGDVYTGFDFLELPKLSAKTSAHLWLVENPAHNPHGDFILDNGFVCEKAEEDQSERFTFSGIAMYRPSFFSEVAAGNHEKLAPLIRKQAQLGKVTGCLMQQHWTDVGTPERLQQLNNE